MMLNAQQKSIIQAKEDLFVKAGAGTGKTSTMVEKCIHAMIDQHLEIHDILAITFTEKAATEMRERILFRLQQHLFDPKTPSAQKALFHRAIIRLPFAWISTIHGFCARLLREYPLQTGLDPSFEILPEYAQTEKTRRACLKHFSGASATAHLQELLPFLAIYRYEHTIHLLLEALNKKRYEMITIQHKGFRSDLAHQTEEKKLQQSFPGFLKAFQTIHQDYLQENQWMNELGFEDLQILALDLLEREESIRRSLQGRFKLIMIDEFQDTNELQKHIIALVKGPDSQLIYVGDGKQSIYRFRQADVRVFTQTLEQYPQNAVYALDTNYRSEPALLDFFNLFFKRIMDESQKRYQIAYEPLRSGKEIQLPSPVQPAVFLLPIVSSWEEEVELVCGAIHRNHRHGQSYREMVVLLRRMSKLPSLEEAMDEWAIPYYVVGSRQFFQKPEIVSLCSLIHVLVDPLDDFEFLSLLRSFLSPFSDAEIVAMRSHDPKSFHAALEAYTQNDEKATSFMQKLQDLRRLYLFSSPKTLVQSCITTFQYDILLGMMPQSRRKLLNLQKFQEIAGNYTRAASWKDFLFHIRQRHEIDEGEAVSESEQSDLVRIMTIHKSKGLEFDTVFLPELGMRRTKSVDDLILIDPEENQISFRPPDQSTRKDGYYAEMAGLEEEMSKEEEKRILYVAMTRAKKSLFLSASDHKKARRGEPTYFPLLQKGGLMGEDFKWYHPPQPEYLGLVEEIAVSELAKPERIEQPVTEVPILPESIPDTAFPVSNPPYRKHISPSQLLIREQEASAPQINDEKEDQDPWFQEKAIKLARLGTMNHHALQLIGHHPLSSLTEDVLKQRAFWEGIPEKEITPVWNMIQRWQKTPNTLIAQMEESLHASEMVLSEKKVMRRWKKYILNGVVDKLFCHQGTWKIVEFKSSRYDQEQFDTLHRFQVQFYLFCLKALHSDVPLKGYVMYLKDDQIIEVFLDDSFDKDLRERIESNHHARARE